MENFQTIFSPITRSDAGRWRYRVRFFEVIVYGFSVLYLLRQVGSLSTPPAVLSARVPKLLEIELNGDLILKSLGLNPTSFLCEYFSVLALLCGSVMWRKTKSSFHIPLKAAMSTIPLLSRLPLYWILTLFFRKKYLCSSRDYVALILSLTFLVFESVIRSLTRLLPMPVIRWFRRKSVRYYPSASCYFDI